MEAIINIQGEITDGTLIDVVSQFKKSVEPTSVLVNITSVGGYVSEGDAIYNYLKALNLPITTVAKDVCASIATKIFLAGDVRKVEKGIDFLIHNPFYDKISGDAKTLELASKDIKKTQDSLNQFYAKKLNIPIEAIEPLTDNETYLNESQLLALGFAHEIIDNDKMAPNTYKAVAKINTKTNEMNENKEVKSMLQELLDGFKIFAKGHKAKNLLELTDANGTMLTFPNLEPDQKISVGDSVIADNGSYIMIDGYTIIVLDGLVSEIIPAEDSELEKIKEENKALKVELEGLKAENTAKQEAMAKFESQLAKVKAMVNLEKPEEKRQRENKKENFSYEAGKISNLKK